MLLAGQEVKNPLASKLASAFRPFDPGIIILFYCLRIIKGFRQNYCGLIASCTSGSYISW